MTPEQQDFWNQLKFDAQYFAHTCGKEMQGKPIETVNTLCSNYLNLAMDILSTEELTGVVKTWLKHYHLPLEPNKLGKVFDKFHNKYGNWIVKNAEDITTIGCH